MNAQSPKGATVRVHFAGLEHGADPPSIAVFSVDATGKALKRIGAVEGGKLEVAADWHDLGIVALGPNRDPAEVPLECLVPFRIDTILEHWKEHGLILGPELWGKFFWEFVCVSGTAHKCRPWWWDRFPSIDLRRSIALLGSLGPVEPLPIFPYRCLPLCDGIVEVFVRECCCRRPIWPDLLDRLREIIHVIPLPNPPIPWPPGPGPDPTPPLARRLVIQRSAGPVPDSGPSERLYNVYRTLSTLSQVEAEAYVEKHPFLWGFLCTCTARKVGETPLQPGGRISLCFLRPRGLRPVGTVCHRSFAVRIRQLIQGQWVTVYDGPAAHDWFSEGEEIDVSTWNWRAQVCGSGPGTPPPGGALPFVLLEYVTGTGSRHFNFPTQNGVSQVAPLAANSGLFGTGYASDCPWGGSLGLRLWFSPGLEPIARYYRLTVAPVSDAGTVSGPPTILDAPVSWQRFVNVGGNWAVASELLSADPTTVNGEVGLAKIPYWSGGKYWLAGQYHQLWNTALFAHGKYLLSVEVFDAAGAQIKPNGATGPGTAAAFQFRRWTDPLATGNVPFADLAHVLWTDNEPVHGKIEDIRRNGFQNTAECQFITGPADTLISIGFRAYHPRGVSDPTNTFLASYALTWARGLGGPTGTLETGTSDVGEPPAPAHPSNAESVGTLLGAHPAQQRCTFATHLHVVAKHWNGGSRLQAYDYHETASFALSLP